MSTEPRQPELFEGAEPPAPYDVCITLDLLEQCVQCEWTDLATNASAATLTIRCTGVDELTYRLTAVPPWVWMSKIHRSSIRGRINLLRKLFPVGSKGVKAGCRLGEKAPGAPMPGEWRPVDLPATVSPWKWLEDCIVTMGQQLRLQFLPPLPPMAAPPADPLDTELDDGWDEPLDDPVESLLDDPFLGRRASEYAAAIEAVTPGVLERMYRREERRAERAEREAAERALRIREGQRRQAEQQRQREAERLARAALAGAAASKAIAPVPRPPLPTVPEQVDLPPLEFQDTLLNLTELKPYLLAERARLWWVSNQSDDLLALPYCNIQRLDYQIRTALRVIGPLRGRALLSDEVGLGKTIEAGLVIKEYLTRGMIKRFLVLTVPSLVDQWADELEEKFNLSCVTTNQPAFRDGPAVFWRQHPAIVASLHTVKQPGHLAVAQTVNWDMLVVDEAHYLRNRTSQAWQAVNALPRQFLLLLTATPVQNSLEELYNLVTLLQPGQLPSPKEFQARFIDKKQPHRPREPEELRRLLGQIMIRNTRANAGVNLPPRRAETVMFEPDEAERAFWGRWEGEFRAELGTLKASQASLWGHLLLQAAGSSPAAWHDALKSFPNQRAAAAWREEAPLEASWRKRCELVAPLTRGEGGVVIFTQYLKTQAALAESLKATGIPVWVINGQTPAATRQPITEEFHRHAGALLLTHSGTEGRNLQFCHRLINFDLPWNPMEIEQRIGRLHRLGQQHPVRIYNLVQKHTLQEHLLQVLQEKLNLFELVVGETGLILGERFGSDEFAEEVFRRWRESEGRVAEAMQSLGEELATARQTYDQVKALDETLFAKDYEAL